MWPLWSRTSRQPFGAIASARRATLRAAAHVSPETISRDAERPSVNPDVQDFAPAPEAPAAPAPMAPVTPTTARIARTRFITTRVAQAGSRAPIRPMGIRWRRCPYARTAAKRRPVAKRRRPRRGRGLRGLSGSIASGLLDEQHLAVLRQRPEVVGDEALEPVGDLADGVHGGDHAVAHVLRVRETALGTVVVVGLLEVEQGLVQLPDQRLDLLGQARDARGLQLGHVAGGGRQDHRARDRRGGLGLDVQLRRVLLDEDLEARLELALGEHVVGL